jgi:dolichol kinase
LILPGAYAGFLFCWSVAWIAFYGVRTARRYARNKRSGGDPMRSKLKAAGTADDLASRSEGLRKLFHLSGFLIVLAFYVVMPAIAPRVDILNHFETLADARDTITLFTMCCGVVISMHLDTQRILFGEEYGMRHVNVILREKEIGSPAAQTYLIVSSVAAWIVGMAFRPVTGEMAVVIPLVSIVIATFADGMAAVIGKAKGKHKVKRPFNQVKSVEGFVAGFVTALVIALLFLLQFDGGWMVAIAMSVVFLLIDYVSLPIADNALNPIVLTLMAEMLAIVA